MYVDHQLRTKGPSSLSAAISKYFPTTAPIPFDMPKKGVGFFCQFESRTVQESLSSKEKQGTPVVFTCN